MIWVLAAVVVGALLATPIVVVVEPEPECDDDTED